MNRIIIGLILLIALALLASCGGYQVLRPPWDTDPAEDDFGTRSDLAEGDRVRATMVDGRVAEGLLVDRDERALTVASVTDEAHLLVVPLADIVQLEVYREGTGRALSTVAAVAAASAVVYVITDDRARAEPGYWSPAKAAR